MKRRKGYVPVFHRESRKKVVVAMTMHPVTARAFKRLIRRRGHTSVGAIAESLIALFLSADRDTRFAAIAAGHYDPSENKIARRRRQASYIAGLAERQATR